MTDTPKDQTERLYLGRVSDSPQNPSEFKIDTVPNESGWNYTARFTCPEFTSLCPVTGQPDFAHFVIDYQPRDLLIESKALKLFMVTFRNHAAFHETCTTMIAKRLYSACIPIWMRVCGFWYPRGGIPIDVFWQSGQPSKGLYIPDPGVSPYRARV